MNEKTTMTKDEALKLALEALLGNTTNPISDPEQAEIEDKAITAIKEVLEQPPEERNFCPRCGKRAGKNDWDVHTCSPPQPEIECPDCKQQRKPDHTEDNLEMVEKQEPVAWVCEGSMADEKHAIDYWPGDVDNLPIGTKLYATPPQRKPLTRERLLEIADAQCGAQRTFEDWVELFGRCIEAAHGIEEN